MNDPTQLLEPLAPVDTHEYEHSAERAFAGKEPDQPMSAMGSDFLAEFQRAELDRIRAALTAWQPVRAELINYTRSGEEFWLELDIVPIANENGRYTHWVAVERDITERKRAEEEIRQIDERFRLISSATSDLVWDMDLTTNETWWNEKIGTEFG